MALDARLRFKNHISGTWDNMDANDDVHGSFLLTVPAGGRGTQAVGLWVGVDRDLGVASGPFRWRFVRRVARSEALAEALRICARLAIPTAWTGDGQSTNVWPDEAQAAQLTHTAAGPPPAADA